MAKNAAVWMRILHYYASMFCCFLFLFYAVSGFIATHADWFLEGSERHWNVETRIMPEDMVDDEAQTEAFCRDIIATDAQINVIENDEDELWYLVKKDDQALRCMVDEEQVEIYPLQTLPGEVTGTEAIADHIAGVYGVQHNERVSHDEEYQLIMFDLESVWYDGEVVVLQEHGLFSVKQRPALLIRAISDLHRGKNSSALQTFLADLTAFLLLFVVVTGAIIGIQMKKKRRWGIIGLSVSMVLTVILLIAR